MSVAGTFNLFSVLGVVATAPDVTTVDGNLVAHFRLETKRRNAHPDVHRITAWGRLAKLCRDSIHAGDHVLVHGTIEYGTTTRDGLTLPTTEVVAKEIVLIPKGDR